MKNVLSASLCLALVLAATVPLEGAGYRATWGAPPDAFPLVVVSGTPYEMGRSLGALMRPEMEGFVPRFLAAAEQAGGPALSAARLDEAWRTMEPFMGSRFQDELRGLAEGSGLAL